jgi:hypothetical protein
MEIALKRLGSGILPPFVSPTNDPSLIVALGQLVATILEFPLAVLQRIAMCGMVFMLPRWSPNEAHRVTYLPSYGLAHRLKIRSSAHLVDLYPIFLALCLTPNKLLISPQLEIQFSDRSLSRKRRTFTPYFLHRSYGLLIIIIVKTSKLTDRQTSIALADIV